MAYAFNDDKSKTDIYGNKYFKVIEELGGLFYIKDFRNIDLSGSPDGEHAKTIDITVQGYVPIGILQWWSANLISPQSVIIGSMTVIEDSPSDWLEIYFWNTGGRRTGLDVRVLYVKKLD